MNIADVTNRRQLHPSLEHELHIAFSVQMVHGSDERASSRAQYSHSHEADGQPTTHMPFSKSRATSPLLGSILRGLYVLMFLPVSQMQPAVVLSALVSDLHMRERM